MVFLTVIFHWTLYKMKSSCYQESSVIHGYVVYRVFGWEIPRLSSRKSDFGWHRFRFSPCLMRKRVEKPEAILAFKHLIVFSASRMVSLSNYFIWCLFLYLVQWSRVYFMGLFSLCTFVRFETMIWPSIRFDYKLIEL